MASSVGSVGRLPRNVVSASAAAWNLLTRQNPADQPLTGSPPWFLSDLPVHADFIRMTQILCDESHRVKFFLAQNYEHRTQSTALVCQTQLRYFTKKKLLQLLKVTQFTA
uniref:(northern house mosquito) hypothetical protein n=1 Tax=Culex pipiens TaxID=7175 RepID=A0A8D8JAJ6_CULPI